MTSHVLDPRVKLGLLCVTPFYGLLPITYSIELFYVGILLLLFGWAGRWQLAGRLLVIYSICWLLFLLVMPRLTHPYFIYCVSFFAKGMRETMPMMLVGLYAMLTTQVSEWLAVFKRWHVPRFISIPLAVFFRFLPTIGQDYLQIRRAMAIRGIATDYRQVIKYPWRTFEYILVPLLMNADGVAQDLTISAMTKGLSLSGKQTSITSLQIHIFDAMVLMLLLVPIIYMVWR